MNDTSVSNVSRCPNGKVVGPLAVALAILCLLGCGGGLSDEFAGRWAGPVVVSGVGGATSYTGNLAIFVNGDEMEVAGFCLAGGGSIFVMGEGSEATWTGGFVCPLASAQCPTATLAYSSASLRVSDGVLRVTASGVVSSCGSVGAVSVTFTGTQDGGR